MDPINPISSLAPRVAPVTAPPSPRRIERDGQQRGPQPHGDRKRRDQRPGDDNDGERGRSGDVEAKADSTGARGPAESDATGRHIDVNA